MNKIIVTICTALLVAGAVFIKIDSGLYDDVKSGKVSLWCMFQDGERKIDPNHIESYDPDYGWAFFNGSAKNCRVE